MSKATTPARSRDPAAITPVPATAFTLRQLEAFVSISLNGSVSAAAARLSRTQSAISMTLQDLETALGTSLFERRGRRLFRTSAAQALLPRAIELVDRAREIRQLVSDESGTGGRLAIGASRTIGPFVMPALLRDCQDQLSGVQLRLTVTNSEHLLRQVQQFELDCAFIEGNVSDPALNKQPWLADELCLVARADHPIFKSRAPLATRLAAYQWVLREPGSGTREIFLRAIAPILKRTAIALELDDPETQKRMVRQSDYLSCISRRAIVDDPRDAGLREITGLPPALKRALSRRFWIVTHPDRYRTHALDILLSAANRLGQ